MEANTIMTSEDLKEIFDNEILGIELDYIKFNLFDKISKEDFDNLLRVIKPIINGYRMNYIKTNKNKLYRNIDYKYIYKCKKALDKFY